MEFDEDNSGDIGKKPQYYCREFFWKWGGGNLRIWGAGEDILPATLTS